ncbi:hypothetical protein HU200_040004 [Digitaria exilis]|uniref:Phytocyanin domain-containing protein n=1 Tax=Digitaria exilis TaxID=1010633 RepID=A0A835B8D0_9POAL|nr:hypothetical protein HU200_040004 [Digitaria exilis]CAB3482643.1 unnamed protein product [Digitaria exilis]
MATTAALFLCVSVVLAAATAAEARDFAVDLKAQAQPDALTKWASINRFQVGDNLVFKLGAGESVLEVSRDDFNRCSTAAPLATHKATAGGSAATVPLPRSGPYYFVGGAPGSCQKGERLFLVVMSQKHSRGHHRGLAPAPAPEAESPLAASFVGGPAAAPAPVTGAAGKTTAAGNGALLLGAAAVLGALLVGW